MTTKTKIRVLWLCLALFVVGLVLNFTGPARTPAPWWFLASMTVVAVVLAARLWQAYRKPQ